VVVVVVDAGGGTNVNETAAQSAGWAATTV
jgi:hypothetical protein